MSNVEKVTIPLTPEMAGFIRNAVDAGEYPSTSEAIRHAVREWKECRDLLGYYTVEELGRDPGAGMTGRRWGDGVFKKPLTQPRLSSRSRSLSLCNPLPQGARDSEDRGLE